MNSTLSHFHALRRAFKRRFYEHELLAADGDPAAPLADLMGILITFGAAVCFQLAMTHSGVPYSAPRAIRAMMAWGDELLLMSISIAVAAVFVVVCWEALFPDLTDCLVLSPMPVRMWTVFAAKLGAVLPVFGLLVACTNLFPIVAYPPMMSVYLSRPVLLSIAAYAVAFGAASVFVLASAVALQGLLVLLLPHRVFQRSSAYVQAAMMGSVLLMFFVTPQATLDQLSEPGNRLASALLPPFWFVGVYEAVVGNASPEVPRLVWIATGAIAAALALAGLAYSFGYARYVRRTIQGAGARRSARSARRAWAAPLAARTLPDLRERALFNFVWRTMVRSRTHRLLLAGYIGVGVAYLVIRVASAVRHDGWPAMLAPNAALAGVPIVISFFVLLGMRVIFSLPVNLKANWLFRMLETGSPERDVAAVRKLMLAAGVLPSAAAAIALYPALWGAAAGLRFAAVAVLIALVVLEALMLTFHKIPFTCAYLPGKANLKMTFGLYIGAFIGASILVSRAAAAAAKSPFVFASVALPAAAAYLLLVWLRRRTAPGDGPLVYDELPEWKVITLDLG